MSMLLKNQDSDAHYPPDTLKPFFNPENVAIIGASAKDGSIGNVIFSNFIRPEFKGNVYPVNPRLDMLLGYKCYHSIKDIKAKIDLAVVAVSSGHAISVMEELAEKKVKAAIIISGGFKETGPTGARLEAEIVRIAKENDIRIMGPNCVGVYDTRSFVDTIFLPKKRCARPDKGHIALLSQSGAIAAAVMDYAKFQGIGVSKIISLGNKADVDESDCLLYLKDDADTKVICCYMEGLAQGQGKRFIKVAREVTKDKPVLIIKGGRTENGTRAALSHTGSLSGHDQIYDAAFKQAGILRMPDFEELFDLSKCITMQPLPEGPRVLVLTNGGGAGVLSVDACYFNGLEVPELSSGLQKRLQSMFPPHVAVKNPVDLTGDTDSARYELALTEVLKTHEVDMSLVILMVQVPLLEMDIVDRLSSISQKSDSPIVVCTFGGAFTGRVARMIEDRGLPTIPTPERAAKALANLYRLSQYRKESLP
ncbi:MAG: acetate--CoA ligase family protein [Candidatus Ranarchaeia archaeon]